MGGEGGINARYPIRDNHREAMDVVQCRVGVVPPTPGYRAIEPRRWIKA